MTPREGLDFAIDLFGSQKKLADVIGFSQDAIKEARQRGRPTPHMAKNIELATKGQVTRLMLVPDVFGDGKRMVKNSWSRGHLRSRRRRRR